MGELHQLHPGCSLRTAAAAAGVLQLLLCSSCFAGNPRPVYDSRARGCIAAAACLLRQLQPVSCSCFYVAAALQPTPALLPIKGLWGCCNSCTLAAAVVLQLQQLVSSSCVCATAILQPSPAPLPIKGLWGCCSFRLPQPLPIARASCGSLFGSAHAPLRSAVCCRGYAWRLVFWVHALAQRPVGGMCLSCRVGLLGGGRPPSSGMQAQHWTPSTTGRLLTHSTV